MLVPVYDATGRVVATSQVQDYLSPLLISADIPRGKAGRFSGIWKNLQSALEDSEAEDYSGESEQGSNEEDGHPTDEKLPCNDEREEELIPNPELQGLSFEAMLRSVLLTKHNVKKARRRETELRHTTRVDTRHLQDIPGPNPVLAVIKTNALQAMYGQDAFKPPALLYLFGAQVEQEDTALVQMQEIVGLLGDVIISTMVVLLSVRQHL